VTLSFTVNRQGRVLGQRVVRSSGHSSLDREVLAMIQRAQPLPAFPAAMTQSQVRLSVPIRFSLR
jgi:protein TonB